MWTGKLDQSQIDFGADGGYFVHHWVAEVVRQPLWYYQRIYR